MMDDSSHSDGDADAQDQYQDQLRAAAYQVYTPVHTGGQDRSRIPEPATYSPPSPSSDRRSRLARTVQDSVLPTDVVELECQGEDGEDGLRVAVVGIKNVWKLPMHDDDLTPVSETSFAEPAPRRGSACSIGGAVVGTPSQNDQETSPGGSRGDRRSRRSWPPPTSRDDDDMDSYNGNELGPPPTYASVVDRSGGASKPSDVRLDNLSREDLQDLDNGNAPEFEHLQVPRAAAQPDPEPTPPVRGRSRESGGPFPAIWRKMKSNHAKAIVIACVVTSLAALFLLTFPLSFVYVEHYELALKRSRTTGKVETNTVYRPGCYILGPDTELVRMPGSAHFVSLDQMQVHTTDRLAFKLSATLQYFIIPEKLGELYSMFTNKYGPVFEKICSTTIQNEGTKFSLNDFQFRRAYIEKYMHKALKTRFKGNCCPSCCPGKCGDNNACASCRSSDSCHLSYPIDIHYFQLGQVGIPGEISNIMLKRSILVVENEAEKLKLERAVITKETDRQVQQIENQAREVLANATARGTYLRSIANIEAEAKAITALKNGLRDMCKQLNITKEEHKMSMYMIRTIEDSKKIYVSPDFTMRSTWVQQT